MRTRGRTGFAVLMLAASVSGVAADDIQWSQTLDLPPGMNLPDGLAADILGISMGEDYASAKARLEAIRAETPDAPPLRESLTQYYLNTAGGSITASFVGEIFLERNVPGAINSEEKIWVRLTAPSSGSQVISVERTIRYLDQSDEIRISDLLAALSGKMGGPPDHPDSKSSASLYRYQFDNGRQVPAQNQTDCYDYAETWSDQASLYMINESGTCDIVLDVQVAAGISDDHARGVTFKLYDNDRAKASLGADYDFFNAYVDSVQNAPGGNTPKL